METPKLFIGLRRVDIRSWLILGCCGVGQGAFCVLVLPSTSNGEGIWRRARERERENEGGRTRGPATSEGNGALENRKRAAERGRENHRRAACQPQQPTRAGIAKQQDHEPRPKSRERDCGHWRQRLLAPRSITNGIRKTTNQIASNRITLQRFD